MTKKLKITQVKSGIGRLQRHKDTLKALGIRKMHQTVIKEDSPAVRGMVKSVNHLVQWEEIND